MQNPVALCAQIATSVALDNGSSFSVVVIAARGLKIKCTVKAPLPY